MVPVYVLNRDTAPIDVRATTQFGDHKISTIAPGKAYYHRFETGSGAVPAGSTAQRLAPGASFTVTDPADRSPVAVFTVYKVVDSTPVLHVRVTKRP